MTIANIEHYIKRMKNPVKKAYAQEYLRLYLTGKDFVLDNPRNLSAMAAQAVRMQINKIVL